MAAPKTLLDAVKHFTDPVNCREFMVARRWPNGVVCPQCGSDKVYFDSSRNGWECKTRHPKRKFTLKTGTIFEDSPLGLDKWLPAVWMIANMKNGVSSHELGRAIGVTQKTAWFMLQRIRLALQDTNGGGGKLGGEVEADETYIGGKARFMHKERRHRVTKHGSKTQGKIAVMGLLERHGGNGSRVRLAILPNARRQHIRAHIDAKLERGATLHTDALQSYRGFDSDYVHNVIDHAEAYVDGTVHTNGLENFWSLLKRAIKGTYSAWKRSTCSGTWTSSRSDSTSVSWTTPAASISRFAGPSGKRLMYQDLIGASIGHTSA